MRVVKNEVFVPPFAFASSLFFLCFFVTVLKLMISFKALFLDVADFVEGQTPKSVGAKHYMCLVRQAKKYYPRYAEYITQLRHKALN